MNTLEPITAVEPVLLVEELSKNDLPKLKKLVKTPAQTSPENYCLICISASPQTPILINAIPQLTRIIKIRQQALTEAHIESLVDILLHNDQRASVDIALEMDNAELRAEYLRSTPTCSSAEVRKISGLMPKNTSEPASRWRREKKVFSVRYHGTELFPGFQFENGEPRDVIKSILTVLPEDMSPWQIALWFASENGWLGSRVPQDCLNDKEAVVTAAQRVGGTAIG